MHSRSERWFFIITTIIVMVSISLPYLLAARAAGREHIFAGFLLNPLDGNSYLAKMYEGWRGEWLFTLPYTAETGRGSLLFIFYLLLGNLARQAGISLLATFHAARLLAALALLFALHRFLSFTLAEIGARRTAFAMAVFGSGMGWLALPFGAFTPDFWVAETYPFLSAYANPHFPLGLALLLSLLTIKGEKGNRGVGERRLLPTNLPIYLSTTLPVYLSSLALSLISPFGVVIALVVLGGLLAWEILPLFNSSPALVNSLIRTTHTPDRSSPVIQNFLAGLRSAAGGRFLATILGGAPLLLYDLWAARSDSLLAAWDAQNRTPSPPPWELIIALSPVLLLAIPGGLAAWKRRELPYRLVLIWSVLGLALLYLPLGLQRRFMMGLYVPLVALAFLGLEALREGRPGGIPRRLWALPLLLFLLALPTNLLVLLAALHGVQTRDPMLFLSRSEALALEWIQQETPPDALILAAPDTGLFIPAHTGRRVLYGHPFETANAEKEKAAVTDYFEHPDSISFLTERGVDYVFAGPRERSLNPAFNPPGLPVVFHADGVVLYASEQ
jgi:hypothetical protein